MRVLSRGLATLLCVVGLTGCSDSPKTPPPSPASEQIPALLDGLKQANTPLGFRFPLVKLGELGPEANTPEVIKALEEAKKRMQPAQRKLCDETLAKIKGSAPPSGATK